MCECTVLSLFDDLRFSYWNSLGLLQETHKLLLMPSAKGVKLLSGKGHFSDPIYCAFHT